MKRQSSAAFPTVANFRHLGDFWGQAGDEIFAKIASEIWAIFSHYGKIENLGEISAIIGENGRFLVNFGGSKMLSLANLAIFRGWRILATKN